MKQEFRWLVGLPVVPVLAQVRSEPSRDVSPRLPLRMVKEFDNGHLLDISPESPKLCIYYGNSLQTYAWSGAAWKRGGRGNGRFSIQVVRLDSWTVEYSSEVNERPRSASFYNDGESLYVEEGGSRTDKGFAVRNLFIDLKSRNIEEHVHYESPGRSSRFYLSVLQSGRLMGLELGRGGYRALVLADAVDLQELRRTEVSPLEALGTMTDIVVSNDRKILAYAVDHSIVCRRTETFDVLWQHPVEAALRVSKIAISPDGGFVAIAAVNTNEIARQNQYYVAVLDSKNGSLLRKLDVNADAGISISPGGKFLAVSQRKPNDKPQKMRPQVWIYDIASGVIVGTATHEPAVTPRGYLWAILESRFTPDGRYLITLGDGGTRVWEL